MRNEVKEHSAELDDYEGFRRSNNSTEEWIAALAQGKTPQGNRNIQVILRENTPGNVVVPDDIAHGKTPSLFVEYAGEKPHIEKSGGNYFHLQADNSIVYIANSNGEKFRLITSKGNLLPGTDGPILIGRKVQIFGPELTQQYRDGVVVANAEALPQQVVQGTVEKIAAAIGCDAEAAEKIITIAQGERNVRRALQWLAYARGVTSEKVLPFAFTQLDLNFNKVKPPVAETKKDVTRILKAAKAINELLRG